MKIIFDHIFGNCSYLKIYFCNINFIIILAIFVSFYNFLSHLYLNYYKEMLNIVSIDISLMSQKKDNVPIKRLITKRIIISIKSKNK